MFHLALMAHHQPTCGWETDLSDSQIMSQCSVRERFIKYVAVFCLGAIHKLCRTVQSGSDS
jgi:hypothetical protein